MTDDHDQYEWANVSSGTGSPGLSRTKSRAEKRFVCVYVVLMLNVASSKVYCFLGMFTTVNSCSVSFCADVLSIKLKYVCYFILSYMYIQIMFTYLQDYQVEMLVFIGLTL